MGEIQGLYASGHNQDVDTFSKSSPFPARDGVATFFAAQSQWLIHHLSQLVPVPHTPSPLPQPSLSFLSCQDAHQ